MSEKILLTYPTAHIQRQLGGRIVDAIIPHRAFIEIKYTFVSDAYYQLKEYQALAQVGGAWPTARDRLIIVCRNYTPGVKLPVETIFLKSLDEIDMLKEPCVCVLIWSRYD